jgi:hypothetical protein
LYKKPAILFGFCIISALIVELSAVIQLAINNILGGHNMENISSAAFIPSVTKAVYIAFLSVTAGLSANGMTPHLY